MLLKDIRIIDLKRSVIDKEKSDPTKGRFAFIKKVYVAKDLRDASTRPEHHLEWAFNSRDGNRVQDYLFMEYTFVELSDPYYPEGAILNAENHWVFKDTVLMKVPMIVHLRRVAENIKKSDRKTKDIRNAFKNEMRDPEFPGERLGVDISDEQIDKALGVNE